MHVGEPLAPHDLLAAWTLEPFVVASLAASAVAYAFGVRRAWAAAGVGRGIRLVQATSFAAGLLTILVALVSPLDALAATLFSAHMGQHLLLILVAPPLLIAGNPGVALLWLPARDGRTALMRWWRRSALRDAWHFLTSPASAWTLHAAAVLAWHLPPAFDAALRSEAVHALEHASFLGTALLFWWPLVHPAGRRRLGYAAGLLYLFGMFALSGALGALLTFAPAPIYAYGPGTAAWGLTALDDQQLAGLIMWIPAGAIYVIAAGVLVLRWLGAESGRTGAVIFAPEVVRPRR